MDPTKSQSFADLLNDIPDVMSDLNGLLDQSSISNAFGEVGSGNKLPFSG